MLRRDTNRPEWAQYDYYDLRHNLDPGTHPYNSWEVDAITGEVLSAYHSDAHPPWEMASEYPFGPLTEEDCRQIADSFVRAHYSGFGVLNMHTPSNGEWHGCYWEFLWWEKLACGASTPNFVGIQINPLDGRGRLYYASRTPMPTHPDLQLEDAQQAIAAAAQAVGIVNLMWNDEAYLHANPEGVFWTVAVGGEDINGDGQLRLVTLNAVTGELVSSAVPRYASSVSKSKTKSDGSKLVWIRELAESVPNAQVNWLGRNGAELILDGLAYTVKPNSRTVKWKGGSIELKQCPVMKNGKLMVPESLINDVRAQLKTNKEG